MPSQQIMMDIGFPSFTGGESLNEKVDAMYGYQMQLLEWLRYTLRHLSSSNFDSEGIRTLTEPIALSLQSDYNSAEISIDASGIEAVIKGLESTLSGYVKSDVFELAIESIDGDITQLRVDMDGFETRVEGSEKNYSSLKQTVDSFSTRISTAEGEASEALQTAEGFETRVSDLEGNYSSLKQTVNSFSTRITNAENNASEALQTAEGFEARVSNAEGDITSLEQTVDSFSISVSSGSTGSTTFKLTADGATLSTQTVALHVKAANIYGKLTADQIETGALTAGTIQGEEIYILHDDGTEIGQIVTEPTTTGDGLAINTDWGGIRMQSNYGNVFLKSWKALADSGDATPQLMLGADGGPYVCAFSGGALVLDSLSFGDYLPDNPVYGQVYFLRV